MPFGSAANAKNCAILFNLSGAEPMDSATTRGEIDYVALAPGY